MQVRERPASAPPSASRPRRENPAVTERLRPALEEPLAAGTGRLGVPLADRRRLLRRRRLGRLARAALTAWGWTLIALIVVAAVAELVQH